MQRAGLLALVLTGSLGCVSWHSGTALPSAHVASTKRIFLDASFTADPRKELSEENRRRMVERISDYARDVFAENWAPTRDQADYVLKVDVTNAGSPNLLVAIFCFGTLGIVPLVAVDDYTIDAELDTKDGRKLGARTVHERLTTLFELLAVFGMPFAYTGTVMKALFHEAFTDLAAWSAAR